MWSYKDNVWNTNVKELHFNSNNNIELIGSMSEKFSVVLLCVLRWDYNCCYTCRLLSLNWIIYLKLKRNNYPNLQIVPIALPSVKYVGSIKKTMILIQVHMLHKPNFLTSFLFQFLWFQSRVVWRRQTRLRWTFTLRLEAKLDSSVSSQMSLRSPGGSIGEIYEYIL